MATGAPWAAKRLTRAGEGAAADEFGARAGGGGGAAANELGARVGGGGGGAVVNELGARARGAPRAPTRLESAGGGGGSGINLPSSRDLSLLNRPLH